MSFGHEINIFILSFYSLFTLVPLSILINLKPNK